MPSEKRDSNQLGLPLFGTLVPGAIYRDRPGAYAVIGNGQGEIAVVVTAKGQFLPGGGIEACETADEALMRECLEECGLKIIVGRRLGSAIQLIESADEGYLRIIGTFFLATINAHNPDHSESGHELIWMDWEHAAVKMRRPFEAWAIRRACALTAEN